jgi:hypothetical protein
MKPDSNVERKKKLITLATLAFFTVGLVFLLLSSLWRNNDPMPLARPVDDKSFLLMQQNKSLQQYDELLHGKLNALQQSDKEFAASLTDSNGKSPGDLNRVILQQEHDFSKLVDSIRLEVFKFTDADIKNNFSKMITSFRLAADNREAMGSLRNAVAMNSDGFSTDEKSMLKMKNELDEKTAKITALENLLKAAAKNNTAKKMKQNIAALESKMAALSAVNNTLKQDNDRLLKQQNETGTNSSNNEVMLKDKTIALQQKVESLNAELQLLKVDCNLSRVDATQIISTAKQRKLLLTEASSILTDLSASNNADIKKKVREKIVRLNQVAANSRD